MSQNPDGQLISYEQRFQYPDQVTGIANGIEFSLGTKLNTDNDRRHYRRQMQETHQIKWKAAETRSLSEWINQVLLPWQALLSLATRDKSSFLELHAYYPSDTPNTPTGLRRCEIYHSGVSWTGHSDDLMTPSEMLFSLTDIQESLSTVMERMPLFTSDSGVLKDLFLAVRPVSEYLVEEHCFRTARALEAYHRLRIQVDEIDPNIFSAQIAQAKASLPEDMLPEIREWAARKLDYSYEPSLRARIKAMLTEWDSLLRPILTNSDRRNKFIHFVINTRNCQAHGGQGACATYQKVWTWQ